MMEKTLIGDKSIFAIEFAFLEAAHETEIAMFVDGENILAFDRGGQSFTTRWNLDELVEWLRKFIDEMSEDPYPVECEGRYAAQKDDIARDFETEDDDAFDAYYEKLYDWDLRHRWHSASSGAILADVYFQLVGENIEISWNNAGVEEGVCFRSISGGLSVGKEVFYSVVHAFLSAYSLHWFPSN